VSFQPPADDSYPHRWLILRACDGAYTDRNAAQNLAWAQKAVAAGRLDGFTVYVVYRPGLNSTILATLDRLRVPGDCMVMVDAESWGGQISGDQSAGLNGLVNSLAARQGSQGRVWGYANRSDYASLWPGRPSWLGLVVASYGGTRPPVPGMIGWQYSDGTYQVAGLPSSSPPFGACDHNELYLTTQPKDDMTPAESKMLVDLHDRLTKIDLLAYQMSTQVAPAVAAIRVKVNAPAPTASSDAAAIAQALASQLGPALAKQVLTALGAALSKTP
jgi:hypothetical protein